MQTLLHDARYAVRMLLRQPVFALVALLTLALGIGANTAIFSLIDSVLLRPLPFAHADRLVDITAATVGKGNDDDAPLSLPRYEFIRDQQDVFEDIGVRAPDGFTLTGRGDPAQIQGAYTSARFFQTLGIQPLRGRLFLPEEDLPGGPKVVLVSDRFWHKHCASDPGLPGGTIILNGEPYTVVGIFPLQQTFPFRDRDLFVPGVFNTPSIPANVVRQGGAYLTCTARLKPGVSLERANGALRLLADRYRQAFPAHVDTRTSLKAVPLQEAIVGDSRPMFYTLAATVGCVLLIACVNVANLLLARLAGRRKEIAVRAALGAGRLRLARQFLVESLLLTLLAGILGTLLALWCVDLAHGIGPRVIPRVAEIHLSGTSLLFTLAIATVAGVLLGTVPALHAARGNPGEALQQSGARGSAGGLHQGRVRAALLVVQVALSLVLLCGTGLLLTSLWQLQRVQLGYNPDGVATTFLTLSAARYSSDERRAECFARLTEQARALPGVRGAAACSWGPLVGYSEMFVSVYGQPVPPIEQRPHVKYASVDPEYFKVMETPIARGRAFTERDRNGSPPVMVINETMARKFFPNGDAVGQKMICTNANPTVTEIVGIMADAHTVDLSKPPVAEAYFSMYQRPELSMSLYVRAASAAQMAGLPQAIRKAVHAVDPDQSVDEVGELRALITQSVADRQLLALLLASFAVLALVLAAIGIYGVTAYGVAQRTREIGIRMALGAQRGNVFRLIIGGGMKLIGMGIIVGVVSALGLTRLLTSLLYGVKAGDPLTFAAVVLVLTVVALLANYLPAHRAMQIDPLTALREE